MPKEERKTSVVIAFDFSWPCSESSQHFAHRIRLVRPRDPSKYWNVAGLCGPLELATYIRSQLASKSEQLAFAIDEGDPTRQIPLTEEMLTAIFWKGGFRPDCQIGEIPSVAICQLIEAVADLIGLT